MNDIIWCKGCHEEQIMTGPKGTRKYCDDCRARNRRNRNKRKGNGQFVRDTTTVNEDNLVCKACKPYFKRMKNREHKRYSRRKRLFNEVRLLGGLGRIKQQLKWNKDAHRKVKNLKSKIRYLKKKNETLSKL